MNPLKYKTFALIGTICSLWITNIFAANNMNESTKNNIAHNDYSAIINQELNPTLADNNGNLGIINGRTDFEHLPQDARTIARDTIRLDLRFQKPYSIGQSNIIGMDCTGIAVGPYIILTAKHCFDAPPPPYERYVLQSINYAMYTPQVPHWNNLSKSNFNLIESSGPRTTLNDWVLIKIKESKSSPHGPFYASYVFKGWIDSTNLSRYVQTVSGITTVESNHGYTMYIIGSMGINRTLQYSVIPADSVMQSPISSGDIIQWSHNNFLIPLPNNEASGVTQIGDSGGPVIFCDTRAVTVATTCKLMSITLGKFHPTPGSLYAIQVGTSNFYNYIPPQ